MVLNDERSCLIRAISSAKVETAKDGLTTDEKCTIATSHKVAS